MNFLPGWNPGFIAAGGKLTTIAQVLSATSVESATITAPVGIRAGDLIVMLDVAFGTSPVAEVIPTGFTPIVTSSSGANFRAVLSYKLATGTEGGTSITGMTETNLDGTFGKMIYVFRGNVPATLITVADAAAEFTTGNPAAQTVNASGGFAPLVVLGCYGCGPNGLVNPRTFTVAGIAAKDGEINAFADGAYTDTDAWLAYKIYNIAPADVVIDMDDEATNVLMSAYIQMA
jgi:hypothetical protein